MTAAFFNQVKLDDTQAKGSYGIGLQIGQQLLDSQLAVKTEAVAKGIYDVLNHNNKRQKHNRRNSKKLKRLAKPSWKPINKKTV